ncbi:siphovirus Gp157 family protein [Metasolibacillus sp.]|uniref:siphovirus Gp157 family protein n=1 Tax=Metasolibacillus sp. TaxID=2703680 RepID=UPI0025D7CD06|nr:siphovirus Gp157 family protein [Metasolibacillus sp.]MCT6924601.1 siphovirus Gp157 family protein [Metasolibacillus sp.]MCT6940803.1 siphovirus Gp157 family protein [Metasolibacillus sp.]
MATLYELQGALLQIQRMIEDGNEGLEDTLESIELATADKLEGYAMVIKNVESDIEGLKAEGKRLAERRKAMESNVKRMKDSMYEALLTVEGNRLKTDKFTFSLRKSTSVQIVDESLIPQQFIQTETKISKTELSKALKNGESIAGASLVENQSLSIR